MIMIIIMTIIITIIKDKRAINNVPPIGPVQRHFPECFESYRPSKY